MNKFKYLLLVAMAALCFAASPQKAHGQISVQIGTVPICPYGYFDYPPYDCAPYGYYGPEWFSGGVFIGAGPWYRGPAHFWGHVDNHYDRHNGWHGGYPHRGEHFDAHHHQHEYGEHFNGNERRDGRGHWDRGNHGGHDHDHDHH